MEVWIEGCTKPTGQPVGRETTMSDKKFEMSRRKALIGLGTVGAASAGAGLGTSAYFSDQQEFTGNEIQAGEFSLSVEQEIHGIDQDGIGPDEMTFDENEEDGVWATDTIELEDAKPGDEYEFCWDITCGDNPGYVAIAGESTDETGYEAGNVDADDLWDIDDNEDLSTLGAETLVDSLSIENGESDIIHEYGEYYDTLGELLADLEDGVLLDKDDGDDGRDPITFDPDKTWTLCVKLSIPTDVGNELQGAKLTWDKTFYAEQARHNDDMDAFLDNAAGVHGD